MQTQSVSREIQPLADVVSLALEEARRQGASECEADASLGRGLSVSVRLREVDTLEYQRDRGLAVTVYFGKRKGSASTADLSTSAVRETVEKACAIARYTAEDPYAGLVEPEALAREIPDLDLDHPWDVTPERAIELARECEAAGLAVDPRLANSEGAAVNSQRQTGVYGNSLGFLAGYSATSHSVSCTLIAEAGEDMQRDYWFTVARDPADLEAVASVGRTAAERALAPKAFLARLGTGLLVTELMGHGVNGVTGDYSRGASGFWVEHGAIAYPVHEITIAGNLKPMYRHIVALGDDVDVRGGILTGSLLLDEMTVAGE